MSTRVSGFKLTTTLLVAGLAIALAAAPVAAAPRTAALYTDPAPDAAHPPSMSQLEIPSHGTTMYGVFYKAAGTGPHPTVLLLHGLPGYEQNGDIAQTLRRAGWNVLVFHYRGAWGSGGQFTFGHCIEDVQTALDYLRTPANAERLDVDSRRLVLIGHSMGGFMAGMGAARDPQVLGIAMISAWNPGMLGPGAPPAVEQAMLEEFRGDTGPLSGTTADALLAESKANATAWNLPDLAPKWGSRPVLVVYSNDFLKDADEAIVTALRKSGAPRAAALHLPTDHGYSGQRIALQRALLKWLSQF